jgi:ribose/xylose/arabinose/galactoside ABC-type transport system permease subunit
MEPFLRRSKTFIGLLALFLFASFSSEAFLTWDNLSNVLRQISISGILSVGMTFVILTAGIDLSVGSILALSACFAAGGIKFYQLDFFVALMIALLGGGVVGALNGVVITKGNIQAFIVTLASMTSIRGLAFFYSEGRPIVTGELTPQVLTYVGEGYLLGIPVPAVLFVVVTVLAGILLRRTTFGRHVYAVGGNEEAARLAGINVHRVKIWVYTLSGLLAGLGGLVALGRIGVGNADLGLGYELNAIASVVIGGTSLTGGVGTITGTFIGAVIIGILNNILNLLGVSSFVQMILKGLIILGAVFISRTK